MTAIYKKLLAALNSGRRAALRSECRPAGCAKALICEDDAEWADFGRSADGLSFEQDGENSVLIEYFSPRSRLVILGGGHIALPLSEFGAKLGFHAVVFDDRPTFANAVRFPAAEVICDGFENAAERLKIRSGDYVVIVTRGHRHDQDCLRQILQGAEPYYLGMIGSRRRVAIVKKQLEAEFAHDGLAVGMLSRLHAPIGLTIGAVTPEEIAIAIFAEIIREKRRDDSREARAGALAGRHEYQYAPDNDLLEWLANNDAEGAALVTVIQAEGSTPREAGAKMVVLPDGRLVGSIGGGCAEAGVLQRARTAALNGQYCVLDIDMSDSAEEDGMVCGGRIRVLVEPLT